MTFGLVKHNNNSISAVTSVGLTQGKMTLIKEQTASTNSSIDFVHGTSGVVLDNTYPIYLFKFINIHPDTHDVLFQFNLSADSGSNYNVTKTTTLYYAQHSEDGGTTSLSYYANKDVAQSTGVATFSLHPGAENDESCSGEFFLFTPDSNTFVKHFMSTMNTYYHNDRSIETFMAGYANTTSAINGVRFLMESGNVQSGICKLYGIKGS